MPLPPLTELVKQVRSVANVVAERNAIHLKGRYFAIRSVLAKAPIREAYEGKGHIRFADDDCGNYFVLRRSTGAVGFWDHETGRVTPLTDSLPEFADCLQKMPPMEFDEEEVIEAWIDPEFLKNLRKKNVRK